MTKIRHVIVSISKCDRDQDCIFVKFNELTKPEHMAKYLASAAYSWTRDGMPGTIPDDILDNIRKERFQKNEFTMHFPFLEWQQRNLLLNQQVDIDMPLQLSDVVLIEPEIGV